MTSLGGDFWRFKQFPEEEKYGGHNICTKRVCISGLHESLSSGLHESLSDDRAKDFWTKAYLLKI